MSDERQRLELERQLLEQQLINAKLEQQLYEEQLKSPFARPALWLAELAFSAWRVPAGAVARIRKPPS